MANDVTIYVERDLTFVVSGPSGITKFRLSRIHAQHFAAAITKFAGPTAPGVKENAGTFSTAHGPLVMPKAKRTVPVRINRGGPVYLDR